ncbi:hypothetical protein DDE83_006244 [Stemphylium lycopersici]|uniref:Uncharacterized protein n=1 Tax=Stemphylium lycopersici TaxID=183478 RepID=A0A364MZI0_STELY|nr:hypothetical protein DDE83_006244 [Stemphylium lycopersici]
MARLATPASGSKTSRSCSGVDSRSAPSAALEAVGARPRRAQRRPTKQVSYELANHAKAYLEAGQYASGYGLLCSLLAAGTSISTPAQPYIGYLAPPAYIAFAASIVADPKVTTKAQSKDAIKGADAALHYLQCVRATIDGPAYPTIRKAFSFPEERNRRRGPGHRREASLSPEPGGDIERIAGEAANEKSLWYRADDFWHIVGWAFNCSVVHKKRWCRWKLWLANMCDFLESDWDMCARQAKTEDVDEETVLHESLLWHYIIGDESTPTNRSRRRRIAKAVLATGTAESLKDYPEIWERETVEPKRKNKEDQPVGEVDFETGEVADYGSDEEMQDTEDTEPEGADGQSSDTSDDGISNIHDAMEYVGGQDAVDLRQRLIALLVQAAQALPNSFTRLFDFCDNILEDFILFPTIIFQALLPSMKLPGSIQIAFNANLLSPLISNKPPNYFLTEPTQQHFETKLLPLKGTTQGFASNAKISLILEQMFMYMMNQDALRPTKALRKAMETGIEARHKVVGTGKGKRRNAQEEEQGRKLLQACSERLLGLLEVLEMSSGKPAQPAGKKGRAAATAAAAILSFGSGSSLSPAPDSETEPDE